MPQTLVRITPGECQRFLSELANLSDDVKGMQRFAHKFAHILPEMKKSDFERQLLEGLYLPASSNDNRSFSIIIQKGIPQWLAAIRTAIRNIWRASDVRTKEWFLYGLAETIIFEAMIPTNVSPNCLISGTLPVMPPPTPFEQTVDHLRKHVRRLSYCENPECPAPYYFNQRRSQKYCSGVCALPSQREFKRRWWAKNRGRRNNGMEIFQDKNSPRISRSRNRRPRSNKSDA